MKWNEKRTRRESLQFITTLSATCASMGGSTARALHALVCSSDYSSLVTYSLDYSKVDDHNDAIYSRQILGFFQKLEDLNLGFDKGVVASERFAQSERMCLSTNNRLKLHRSNPSLMETEVASVLFTAQRKISAILGRLPPLDSLKPAFGPGANTNVKTAVASPRAKLSAELQCSNELLPTVGDFLSEVPPWVALHSVLEDDTKFIVNVQVTPGKLIFVPKNAKTFRSIVVEPIVNGFFQKGVGSYLKSRLLRFGVDLRDQSRNQALAKRGSVDGSLATVDLSMASDCMSYELIWELLPYEWAEHLSRLATRDILLPPSQQTRITELLGKDSIIRRDAAGHAVLKMEKFSSMGNGFTFELESIVFYSLAASCCDFLQLPIEDVSVFGDDIIIPSPAYSLLTRVLEYCGFSVNLDKSFSSGPFRESCGADFLSGINIRPLYLSETRLSDETLFIMHNFFLRNGERELAAQCEALCLPHNRIYGPDGYGDGHLVGSHTLRRSRKIIRSGWCGGVFDTYVHRIREYNAPLPGDSVLPCYSTYVRSGEESPTNPYVIQGSRGYDRISVYTLSECIFRKF